MATARLAHLVQLPCKMGRHRPRRPTYRGQRGGALLAALLAASAEVVKGSLILSSLSEVNVVGSANGDKDKVWGSTRLRIQNDWVSFQSLLYMQRRRTYYSCGAIHSKDKDNQHI